MSEFWRRWHICLSTWLRDYLYIPLGGNRGSACGDQPEPDGDDAARRAVARGGWGYVLWGGLHGLMLVDPQAVPGLGEGQARLDGAFQSVPGTALRVFGTFMCVSVLWVLFQPDPLPTAAVPNPPSALEKAATMYGRMFSIQIVGQPLPLHNRSLWYTVGFVLLCHAVASSGVWQRVQSRLPAPVLGLGYALCLCAALVLAPDSGQKFIYFDF